jgi:SulP family sulfate permease
MIPSTTTTSIQFTSYPTLATTTTPTTNFYNPNINLIPRPPPPKASSIRPSPPLPDNETWFGVLKSCFCCDPVGLVKYWQRTCTRMGLVSNTLTEIRVMDIVSGVILSLLLESYSVVFSTTIFDEVNLDEYIGLGVGMQSVSIFFSGIGHAFFSDVGVSIASPDLNPSIFFGQMAMQIRSVLTSPDPKAPLPKQDVILATTLASIIISTMSIGLVLYLLGRLRLTRIMQMIPEACLTGFMAALGYLNILKALRTAIPPDIWVSGPLDPDWWKFSSPAILFGFVMFIRQRFMLGNAGLVVPLVMIVPLLIFYVAYYSGGGTVQQAREQGWLFPYMNASGPGYRDQWSASWQSYDKVNWNALTQCLPLMLLTIVVVCIDAMIKLAGVRKALFATGLGFDHEMMLAGKSNLISGFFVGCPSYNQPPLTQANRDLINNQVSRIPGLIAALLNLVFYVFNFPFMNFFPRFWLSGLIFYVAIGFLAENLLEAGFRLNGKEYLSVWIILITNILAGLGWALLVGLVLSASMFAVAYGKDGSIKSICTGDDVRSSVVRSSREDVMLQHLCYTTVVITLNRYVFFGSASQILDVVRGLVEEQMRLKSVVHRTKYVIFDFALVEDMDITAMMVFSEIIQKIKSMNNEIIKQEKKRRWLMERRRKNRLKVGNNNVENSTLEEEDEEEEDNVDEENRLHHRRGGRQQQQQQQQHAVTTTTTTSSSNGIELVQQQQQQPTTNNDNDDDNNNNDDEYYYDSSDELINDTNNNNDDLLLRRPVVLFTGLSPKQRETMSRIKLLRQLYDTEKSRDLAEHSYTDDEISVHEKRCFETLDLGMEWVEERYLERSSMIRQRWFTLASFLTLHEQAKALAVKDEFEEQLGASKLSPPNSIFDYVERINISKGETLWRAGDYNPQIYLLQRGRLSAFVERYGQRVRSQTLRRGAFVNEDALILSRPVDTTLVADTDSVVLALSKDKMKLLSKEFPEVAVMIYSNILKYAARTRLIVQRAKQARDLFHEPLQDVGGNNNMYGSSSRMVAGDHQFGGSSFRLRPHTNSSSSSIGGMSKSGNEFSLFDTSILNKGLSEGRRIAKEFSQHILTSAMTTNSRTRKFTVANRTVGTSINAPNIAAGRHFSKVVNIEKLDPRLRDDWNKLVLSNTVVHEEDIVRVLGVTLSEAQEMVWEADLTGRGAIQLFDLLDTITTVWEGEVVANNNNNLQQKQMDNAASVPNDAFDIE